MRPLSDFGTSLLNLYRFITEMMLDNHYPMTRRWSHACVEKVALNHVKGCCLFHPICENTINLAPKVYIILSPPEGQFRDLRYETTSCRNLLEILPSYACPTHEDRLSEIVVKWY